MSGEAGRPLLEIDNLRTYFSTGRGVARAVDGVQLRVQRGEILALVGESGSGKSVTAMSILRLIDKPGLIQPDSSIIFDGEDLMGLSTRRMRAIRGEAIALIGQRPMSALNPIRTIGAQGIETLRLHRGLSKKDATAKLVEVMSAVGVGQPEQRLRSYPHELSGGLAQRVAVAMALTCEPRLLVADEPTTALDVTIQANLLARLRSLRDETGMAVLFITHDLGVVADIADRVAVMYGGQVVESGTTAELLADPQHPYTRALLRSTPELGMRYHEPLPTIAGRVPPATAWPTGCRFEPRCPSAFDRCKEAPPLMKFDDDRTSLCWLEPHSAALQPLTVSQ
jgi:oligopeptide/dipeptide ABC transporter ATP-binding protein